MLSLYLKWKMKTYIHLHITAVIKTRAFLLCTYPIKLQTIYLNLSDPDGPAAKAGIKKGDIIKAINGKSIIDIYEYMERLGELREGMTVPVTVDRGDKEIKLSVTF